MSTKEIVKGVIIKYIRKAKLTPNKEDSWDWYKNGYSVRDAYRIIINGTNHIVDKNLFVVWNNYVQSKVVMLVWRLLQNKLPTRVNLIKRGVLECDHSECPFECGIEESETHLFFECQLKYRVMENILND